MPVYSPSEKLLHKQAARENSKNLGLEILSRSDALVGTAELMGAYEAEIAQLPKEIATSFYYTINMFKTFAPWSLPNMTVENLLGELDTERSRPFKPYYTRNDSLLYFSEERADEQRSNWIKKNVFFVSKDGQ